MDKYLLIDGNNLACRCTFANDSLITSTGIYSGVHFGVMQSLVNFKKQFNDFQMLIAWDGKSERRIKETEEAVNIGLIPSIYKANRQKDEIPLPLKHFHEQSNYLKRGIGQLGIPQIHYYNYEADDVIASYAKLLKNNNEVVIITSDKDYYQMLDTNVSIFNGMTQKTITLKSFMDDWGITASQWVDLGALMGDTGDNIFGLPGWGDKTSLKELKELNTCYNIVQNKNKQFENLRQQYPDFNTYTDKQDALNKFEILKNSKTEKEILKYPNISFNMPYTGVAYAFENKLIKINKTSLMCLIYQDRVKLAYSLKKSDDNIVNLPSIVPQDKNYDKIVEYCNVYELKSLIDNLKIFFE